MCTSTIETRKQQCVQPYGNIALRVPICMTERETSCVMNCEYIPTHIHTYTHTYIHEYIWFGLTDSSALRMRMSLSERDTSSVMNCDKYGSNGCSPGSVRRLWRAAESKCDELCWYVYVWILYMLRSRVITCILERQLGDSVQSLACVLFVCLFMYVCI
jgi:hypothetical protein